MLDAGVEAGADGSDAPDASVPHDMLVYYGNGGIAPDTLHNNWDTFDHWEQAITPLGAQFVYTAAWPGALDPFKTVVLVHPGATNGGQVLAAEMVSTLDAWIRSGGTLFLIGDVYSDPVQDSRVVSNRLLMDLGVPIQLGMVAQGQGYEMVLDPSHPLSRDLTVLQCSGYNVLELGTGGVERVDTDTASPKLAAFRLDAGGVVVISDAQCLDQGRHSIITEAERQFLVNLMNWPTPI